jgi:plastocyanin
MKTTTRSNIYLAMAAMILTAALAVPAAAQKQVPFKGTMQGLDKDTAFTPTTVSVTTTGTGIATHLGQFSFKLDSTVTFATGTSAGSATFIAANGDSISATVTGSGEFYCTRSH